MRANEDGNMLSLCLASIDFDSVAAGKKAVALSGSKIAGRPVRVTFSKSSDRGKVCIPSYKAPMYPPATSDL